MGIGSVSISNVVVDLIKEILPERSIILEFGSGEGTIRLSKYFQMYSVENQTEWMNRYPTVTTYINCNTRGYDAEFTAPEMDNPQRAWYNPDQLFDNLPKKYDLILIDGPGGHFGRGGFLKFLGRFNTDIPLIFDDVNRPAELELIQKVSERVKRPYFIHEQDPALGYIL